MVVRSWRPAAPPRGDATVPGGRADTGRRLRARPKFRRRNLLATAPPCAYMDPHSGSAGVQAQCSTGYEAGRAARYNSSGEHHDRPCR